MHSFEELSKLFIEKFSADHFPPEPASLYEPNRYFLKLGGKRVRPVLCLMGNELFDNLHNDAWNTAMAIELFHNFTLIHDDIMDHAPLRRGMETVHEKFGTSTALLAGDVMLVKAYDYLNLVSSKYASSLIHLFNRTAREVCEGQQLDMDFEKTESVDINEYLNMISLKTSVLLAASLKMGAIIGGALERNQNLIYEFGRKLGLAFQVQDDYLDAFGDPKKFGKQVGGDILANKKTFLWIHAMEVSNEDQRREIIELAHDRSEGKVDKVLAIYEKAKVKEWAQDLKTKFMHEAFEHLEDIAVISKRKEPLKELANYLLQREV